MFNDKELKLIEIALVEQAKSLIEIESLVPDVYKKEHEDKRVINSNLLFKVRELTQDV